MQDKKNLLRYFWKELVYMVYSLIYIFCLRQYNKELLNNFSEDDFIGIIQYKNGLSFIYLCFAVLTIAVGSILIAFSIKRLKEEMIEGLEVVRSILTIILFPIVILSTIIAISNPILRAFLSAVTFLFILTGNQS